MTAPGQHEDGRPDQNALLATKLRIPAPVPHLVPRPRLIDLLDQGLARKLVLISASAGSGKTTLLSSWAHTSAGVRPPLAWIALDEQDNDPGRFWRYIGSALGTLDARGGVAALAGPHGAQPFAVEALLTAIINEIVRRAQPLILVLDDYHLITAATIQAGMTFLLAHLPAELHLVVASRTDPPWPLAALRAAGQLAEVRAADLRFSPAEVAQFVQRFPDLARTPDSIAALAARTEGWAAGLQLAALALSRGGRLPGDTGALTGQHKYIFDYLAQEVFRQQPPEVQHFLLNTTILDHLCAALCDAVTGVANGQAMLEYLEQANLFLVPLDNERRWYRYHHLFADFLRARLDQDVTAQTAALHQRASRWYAQHRTPAAAIHHALAARDFSRAGYLIGTTAEATLQRGEIATLFTWLDALPPALVAASPGLGMWYAWMLLILGRAGAIEPYLQQAEFTLQARQTPPVPPADSTAGERYVPEDCLPVADLNQAFGQIAAIRSSVALALGDMPGTIQHAQQALQLIGKPGQDNPTMRAISLLNLGAAQVAHSDPVAAAQAFREAQQISWASGERYNALAATNALADLYQGRGDLPQAAGVYRQALRFFGADSEEPVPAVGMLYLGLGALCYEQNNLDDAVTFLLKGIRAGEAGGSVAPLVRGYVALARAKLARGEPAEAQHHLAQAAERARNATAWPEITYVQTWQARLHLGLGHIAAAAQWAEAYERTPRADVPTPPGARRALQELGDSTLLRVKLACGDSAADLRLLTRLQGDAEQAGRVGALVEFLLLEALALQAYKKRGEAVNRLGRALALATPGGYMRLFLDEGPPLVALLTVALDQGRRRPARSPAREHEQRLDYMHRLLHAFSADTARTGAPRGLPLAPALTARERDVVRLLVDDRPYREIAAALVITEDTAKWHIKNIYRKLQVSGRAHLIERVRELHLLI